MLRGYRAGVVIQPQPSSATVIAFPQRPSNRFTLRDRVELLEWEAARSREAGVSRVALHEQQAVDGTESCDLLLLYVGGGPWARCGAARRGRYITVWRSADGADLGRFETMREALGAALDAAARTPGRRGRRGDVMPPARAGAARASAR